MIVTFLATFFITKIVVMNSGNELYGFYSMSNDFVNYALIVSIALNSMAGRFVTVSYYQQDSDEVNKYFNSVFYANIILAIIMAVPLFLISFNLEKIISLPKDSARQIKALFVVMFVNYLLTIISSVFTVSTFIKNRVDLDSFRQLESNIIKIAVVYLLYRLLNPNIIFIGIATLIATSYVFLMNIYYVKKLTPEIRIFEKKFFDWCKVKEVLSSGGWNSLTRIGAVLLNGLDLLIANQMISSPAMGILSISKTLPKYFLSAIEGFAGVFSPRITIEYAKGNNKGVIQQTDYAIRICGIISNAFASILIVLGNRIYLLWVPGQDAKTLHILTIVAIVGFIVIMPLESVYIIITATNKVKFSSIYLLLESVFTISIVFILLHIVPVGFWQLVVIAGVSSAFEMIRGLIFLPLFGAYCLKANPIFFYKPLIRTLLAFGVSTAVSLLVNQAFSNNSWIILIIMIIITGISSLVFDYFIMFSRDEKKKVLAFLKHRLLEKES